MGKPIILVVEDETDIQELIAFNLKKEGYQVVCMGSGEECVQTAQREKASLVLLDLMLPGIDGFDVCRELKSSPNTQHISIIMLTAKGEDSDIVTGLELGADDYITKPFSPKVLIARVRSVLRRQRKGDTQQQDDSVEIYGIAIDPNRHEVKIDNQEMVLTRTEFRILHLLCKNPGRVFTRDQIVDKVHGDDYPVTQRSIDVQMVGLRRKLTDRGTLIETVRGVGYRLRE